MIRSILSKVVSIYHKSQLSGVNFWGRVLFRLLVGLLLHIRMNTTPCNHAQLPSSFIFDDSCMKPLIAINCFYPENVINCEISISLISIPTPR